jgi:small subunit ribosomal protein S1
MSTVEHKQDMENVFPSSQLDNFIENSNLKNASQVVTGVVAYLDKEFAFIDVGLKSECPIPIREFFLPDEKESLAVGSKVEVFLTKIDAKTGGTTLSRSKAIRELAWMKVVNAQKNSDTVEGIAFSRVKGGLSVDIGGVIAFLPGSQIDVRPVKDVSNIMGHRVLYKVISYDEKNRSAIISRREILESEQSGEREKFLDGVQEGAVILGTVKNITNYGAFIDLGNVDGLLHVTDITWEKISHPSEALTVGQQVKVKIIKYDRETKRLSLGMKQLDANPWDKIKDKYQIGSSAKGKISNITKYGLFVQLEDGIEGLLHLSEISWTRDGYKKFKDYELDQELDVSIIDIDIERHRLGLSIKRMEENPWEKFSEKHNTGEIITGVIKNITDFGLFVGTEDSDVDGLVHVSDLSWSGDLAAQIAKYKIEDKIQVVYLGTDLENQRIRLGVKQLSDDPFEKHKDTIAQDKIITCKITEVKPDGIEVEIMESIRSFIKRVNLSKDKVEQRSDRFCVGDKVDAKIITLDKESRKLILSIKALEEDGYHQILEQYGSADSGATIGNALGQAMQLAMEKANNKV